MTPLLTLKVCARPATVSKPDANWRKHTRCKHDVDRCNLRAYTLHAFRSKVGKLESTIRPYMTWATGRQHVFLCFTTTRHRMQDNSIALSQLFCAFADALWEEPVDGDQASATKCKSRPMVCGNACFRKQSRIFLAYGNDVHRPLPRLAFILLLPCIREVDERRCQR